MRNCLVTKLKGSVNNDSLHKFGYTDIPVSAISSITPQASPSGEIYVDGGDGLIDGVKSKIVERYATAQITGTTGTLFFPRESKYNITLRNAVGVDVNHIERSVRTLTYQTINLEQGELADFGGTLSLQSGSPIGAASDWLKYDKLKALNLQFLNSNPNVSSYAYGYLQQMPNIEQVSISYQIWNTEFNRPSTYPVLKVLVSTNASANAMPSTVADAYLINMANCIAGEAGNIRLQKRTHESDAAVSTLEGMGYTITCEIEE